MDEADGRRIEVSQWLARASDDLRLARHGVESMDQPPLHLVCFLAQQAAEKALKAFLVAKGRLPQRTHNLVVLVQECETLCGDFARWSDAAVLLTPYAVASRYPGDVPQVQHDEAVEALETASGILQFVRESLPFSLDD